MNSSKPRVLVVGAGIMGAGIAQVAAQAGHEVSLFDLREGAAAEAKAKLASSLQSLAAKGKLEPAAVEQTLARIGVVASLSSAEGVGLVIEAIVEKIDAKRALFRELESIVGSGCLLATNTSSISVTAIANGLQHPGRLVGMHFFNPVPLMKLVEVVSGLQTETSVADAIVELARAWGKVPVRAKSTPGFIVNRIARPYYAEALALLLEQAASPAVIDACLRGAGFRMGPCELMDLIGHDTNFAVTQSVYEANFYDKRYMPSLVQREMVDGGLLGRKSGRGFYRYPEGPPTVTPAAVDEPVLADPLVLHGADPLVERFGATLREHGFVFTRHAASPWSGLEVGTARLALTDGRTAHAVSAAMGCTDLALFDRPFGAPGSTLAYAVASRSSEAWQRQAAAWLAALNFAPQPVADVPGLVVARTIAMLVNEAADAVHQGVCTSEGADAAMKLGVNYPAGPFEWLSGWGAAPVAALLDALDEHYRGERYRVSPWLRQAARRAR